MEIFLFEPEKDYQTVSDWWTAHQWPVIPLSSLSSTGFIVKDNENSYLAGWVYYTNSDIAWLEFIVANPEFNGELRDQAFDLFFDVVLNYIKIKNFKKVFTSVKHPSLKKRLENNHFLKTDEEMTNFVRSL